MTKVSRIRYSWLPGGRRGVIRTATLWAAEDHLLAVASTRFQEQYKRYYYTDIQSISLQRKRQLPGEPLVRAAGLFTLLYLASFIVLTMVAFQLRESNPFLFLWYTGSSWKTALWIGAAIVVYHTVAGLFFSCECRVHTATSADALPSLYRVWAARAALYRIDQRIRSAQGELPSDWEALIESMPVQERLEPVRVFIAMPDFDPGLPGAASLAVFIGIMALTAAAGVWRMLADSRAAEQALTLSLVVSVVLMTLYAVRLTGKLSRIMIGLATAAVFILAAAYVTDLMSQFRRQFEKDKEKYSRVTTVLQQMDPPALHQAMAAGTVAVGAAGLLIAFTRLRKPQSGL